MNKIYTIIIITTIIVLFTGCQTQSLKSQNQNQINIEENSPSPSPEIVGEYKTISPSEAKNRLEAEADIILLDVRTIEEYNEGHIPSSILIPYDDIVEQAKTKLPDKSSTIFVYCRSGRRSKIATEALIANGYTNVYDLGGIIDWPYEVE